MTELKVFYENLKAMMAKLEQEMNQVEQPITIEPLLCDPIESQKRS
jgi:hypothetical protein